MAQFVCTSPKTGSSAMPRLPVLYENNQYGYLCDVMVLEGAQRSLFSFFSNQSVCGRLTFFFLFFFLTGLGLHCFVQAFQLQHMGSKARGLQELQLTGPRVLGLQYSAWALDHWLSSCGSHAQLICRMYNLPRPGIEPMFPVWAGRFISTAPPEKSQKSVFFPLNNSYYQFAETKKLLPPAC